MKASVIVLVWNGMADLAECLTALHAQESADLEIIVVDNASSDGSADFVSSTYPGIRLIRNERNVGFAAGNNLGLRVATGEILMLLNQDTVVRPDWARALLAAFDECPTCGAVGSKALYPDGRIQHAGGYVDERGEGAHYGYGQPDQGQFEQTRDVDYVTGAAMAVSRRAMEAAGGLDEGFAGAYFEDVDWCYRIREAGFRVVYAPQAVLVHKERSAAGGSGSESLYAIQRNRLRFVLKHWPTARLVEQFLAAERAWLQKLGPGSEVRYAATQRSYLYHLAHLSELVRWRKEALGGTAGDTYALAAMLLTLRSTVPARPAELSAEAMAESLNDLRRCEGIRIQPARSPLPVLGPLLTAFRGLWNRAITAALVLPLFQQQVEFNVRVTDLLQRLVAAKAQDEQWWNALLSECLVGDSRELADLAADLRQLCPPPQADATVE